MLVSHIGLPNAALSESTLLASSEDALSMLKRPLNVHPVGGGERGAGRDVADGTNAPCRRHSDVECLSFWNDAVRKDPLSLQLVLHIITTPGIASATGRIADLEVQYCDVVSLCGSVIVEHKAVVADLFPFVIDKLPGPIRSEFERPKLGNYHAGAANDPTDELSSHCALFEKRVTIETRSRDTKKTPDSEFLYANRQKVSDMFIELLFGQHPSSYPTGQSFSSRFPPARSRLSAKEVHAKLDRRNMDWFVTFFIDEYVKGRSSSTGHATPNMDRLSKLERRLTETADGADDQASCYHSFITMLDSHLFNKTLYSHTLKRVTQQGAATRPSVLCSSCRQLKKLVSLFRFVSHIMDQSEGARQVLQDLVGSAVRCNSLIVHAWWVVREKDMEVGDVVQYIQTSKDLANPHRLVLYFLLRDHPTAAMGPPEWSESKGSTKGSAQGIDSDPSFAGAVIELGMEHSESFRRFYGYCTEGIPRAAVAPPAASTSPTSSSSSSAPSTSSPSSSSPSVVATEGMHPLRKIRPVNELSGPAFEELQLQKRLRQWFWWMYPGLREVIESVCVYLVEQHPDVEERKAKLGACLPTLVPSIWASIDKGPGQVQLLTLLHLLALELLERHSTTASFSDP